MDKYSRILKEYWGFDDFRGIQREIIESIGAGHDTLGLMPTGGGKSITFQIPALASEGTCIVITPLIALMKDQVTHLKEKGIKAAAIYSGMTHSQVVTTLENCILGDYKLLYVSPERLSTELFQIKVSHMRVSFVCVDEAHCISQWGYDFRPSYLNIKQIRKLAPNAPVLALTATATPAVVKDIQTQLEFKEERVFRMSFERKNLAYKVCRIENKEAALKRILKDREGATIIYCRNRQRCKEIAELIQTWGYTATYYHAGLSNTQKDERQHKWQQDKTRIMVATNAFGMGIDKAEVRLVIHMAMPDTIEEYFQEAGRAGRDGEYAEAIMFYNGNDIKTLKKRVDETFPDKELIRTIYDEICCYLTIAIGFGLGHRREFNIVDFCSRFHHFPTIVEHALAILTKAGYVEYTDAEDGISRVMIEVRRDELYYIAEEDDKKSKVIQTLLRHYSGLFCKYVNIDEDGIAKTTGLTTSEVYNTLKQLDRQHILTYIPKKNIPHIVFTSERLEKKHLHFAKEIYDDRKKVLQNHINCMLEYATEDDRCRSKYLLEYFGEKTKKECKQCDICIENQNTPSFTEELITGVKKILNIYKPTEQEIKKAQIVKTIKERIIQKLEESKEGRVHPFKFDLDEFEPEYVRQAADELTDEELIRIDESLFICLNKKK